MSITNLSESVIAAGPLHEGTMKGEVGSHKGVAKQHCGPDLDPLPARRGCCQKVTAARDAAAAEGWIGSVTLPKVKKCATHRIVYSNLTQYSKIASG